MTEWQKKLTKKDRAHIKDMGITRLEDVKENVLHQDRLKFPCWDCVEIGRKLGMDVNLTTFNQRG